MTEFLKNGSGSSEVAINLVRLCFASGKEAEIALVLAQYLGSREGSQIADLRPDTVMDDVLDMYRGRCPRCHRHGLRRVGGFLWDGRTEQGQPCGGSVSFFLCQC